MVQQFRLDTESAPIVERNMRKHFSNTLEASLRGANLTSLDIAWFQHAKGRKFAPLPNCKLRKLAQRAGYTSAADFLAAERREHEARGTV